jgi:hypothetical protein
MLVMVPDVAAEQRKAEYWANIDRAKAELDAGRGIVFTPEELATFTLGQMKARAEESIRSWTANG